MTPRQDWAVRFGITFLFTFCVTYIGLIVVGALFELLLIARDVWEAL